MFLAVSSAFMAPTMPSKITQSKISMYEEQDVARKVVELRASWRKSAPPGKAEPSEEQFVEWAEEHLTEEARGKKVLESLAAQIAADDAKAAEYWNSPEMVAAREARAAKKAAAEKNQ